MSIFDIPKNQQKLQKMPDRARTVNNLRIFRNQKGQQQEKNHEVIPKEQIILKKTNPELFESQKSIKDFYSPIGLIYTVEVKNHIKERHLNASHYQTKSKFNPFVDIIKLADEMFVKSQETNEKEKCAYAVRNFDIRKRKFGKLIKIICDCKDEIISMDSQNNEGNFAVLIISAVDNKVKSLHPCTSNAFKRVKKQWENSYVNDEGIAILTGCDIRFDEILF